MCGGQAEADSTNPRSVGLSLGTQRSAVGVPWCGQTRASNQLSVQISWVASVQRDSKGVSVLVSEAAIDGMWDPLLLWQIPVYSRYLLRPPSSAF